MFVTQYGKWVVGQFETRFDCSKMTAVDCQDFPLLPWEAHVFLVEWMGFCQPAASRAASRTFIRLSPRKQLSCPYASPFTHHVAFMPEKVLPGERGRLCFPMSISGWADQLFFSRQIWEKRLQVLDKRTGKPFRVE